MTVAQVQELLERLASSLTAARSLAPSVSSADIQEIEALTPAALGVIAAATGKSVATITLLRDGAVAVAQSAQVVATMDGDGHLEAFLRSVENRRVLLAFLARHFL